MDFDASLFDECSRGYVEIEQLENRKGEEGAKKWKIIEDMAVKNRPNQ